MEAESKPRSLAKKEFFIVIAGAFGYFILGSISWLLAPSRSGAISEHGLESLLIYESIVLAILCGFLARRGWTFRQLGLSVGLKDIGVGVALALAVFAVCTAALWIGSIWLHELASDSRRLVAGKLNLSTIIAISLLNPVFEELFVCGYIISVLRSVRTETVAVNVSIAVRLSYHLYQGVVGVLNIVPVALIFSYWFARTRRLWPVIVAHAILDFVGLIAYARSF